MCLFWPPRSLEFLSILFNLETVVLVRMFYDVSKDFYLWKKENSVNTVLTYLLSE